MPNIVEADEHGAIYLSPDVIGNVASHTQFIVEIQNGTLVLRPVSVSVPPFWSRSTPAERAKAFMQWAMMERPAAPDIPEEALRRECMYE